MAMIGMSSPSFINRLSVDLPHRGASASTRPTKAGSVRASGRYDDQGLSIRRRSELLRRRRQYTGVCQPGWSRLVDWKPCDECAQQFLIDPGRNRLLGVFSILLLLGTALISVLGFAFRHRRSPQSDLLFGIAGALCAITLHSFYEWMLVTQEAQYLLGIILGIAAGVMRQQSVAARQSRGDGKIRDGKAKKSPVPVGQVAIRSPK